jgi:CHAT domain-containing protein/predicted negative regulator of RcsB-dependent stress response
MMKAPRHLLMLIALLLCVATCLHGQETANPLEMARQLADAANDSAVSLEDRQESLRKLQESARLFLGVNETLEAARVLNRAGRLQLVLSRPRDAVASHSNALDLLKQTSLPEVEVDALNGLGAAYLMLEKKREKAEQVLRRAILLSERYAYNRGRAQALLTLSAAQNTYDHALALQTGQVSLTLWQTLDDKPWLARAYARVGESYMAQNALPEATQNYERALGLWRDLNNLPEQAGALIQLGYIEHRRGEWSSAISLYIQAQSLIDERAEPEKMGQVAAGMGAAFNENGMPESALPYYQRALSYYQQAQNSVYVAIAISRLGSTNYLLRHYPEAIAYFQQAIDLVKDDTLEAECDEYLGRVYISTGKYGLALQRLQSALAVYTKATNPQEVARVQALLGQVAELQGQPDRARQYYRLASETFTRLSDRVNQGAVYYAQGGLELKSQNYEAAENYLQKSIEVTENIRRLSRSTDLTAAFSATVYDRYEKYVDCLMRKHAARPDGGDAVRAFETSELARARALAEVLRSTATIPISGLEPELAEREKSLRQSLRVKDDYKVALLGRKTYQTEELTALNAELTRLEAEYQQTIETIRARYPSYEQLVRPTAWDLKRIQEQVIADDQTVLLEYSLGAEKSYVWAVTRDSITSYELPAQPLIEEAAKEVYKSLSNRPEETSADKSNGATQELARMILSPVSAELTKRRVIVVADDVLNYIPFQILPAPSNNEPLVSNYEVVNAPSASILGELRQEAAHRQPSRVLAAFGAPALAPGPAQRKDANDGEQLAAMQALSTDRLRHALRDIELAGDTFNASSLQPLLYAGRELANLRDVTVDGESLVAADFDATRERLQSTDLSKYAILHFATHGFLDALHPENSGLVLSNVDRNGQVRNGYLGLQDVYNLRAPVDLVVLSACSTGLGKTVRGEGLISLTRGFMYAGASSVVASLWKVDDEATAELMKQFYINMLQREMRPAAALRAAQNSIRQRPEWRAPYYWAAFTLQGEYRQPIKPARPASFYRYLMACAGLSVLLSGLACWYLYRRRGFQRAGATQP